MVTEEYLKSYPKTYSELSKVGVNLSYFDVCYVRCTYTQLYIKEDNGTYKPFFSVQGNEFLNELGVCPSDTARTMNNTYAEDGMLPLEASEELRLFVKRKSSKNGIDSKLPDSIMQALGHSVWYVKPSSVISDDEVLMEEEYQEEVQNKKTSKWWLIALGIISLLG